jgi:beta-N-acetylhexosaminidase
MFASCGEPASSGKASRAAAGVVSGTGGLYHPDAPVSRAQMATFLVRAVKVATGVTLTAARDFFPDDDASPHHLSINAAAAAGLASGAGGGGYAPELTVRRDQMASFLTRVLEFSVQRGALTPAQR